MDSNNTVLPKKLKNDAIVEAICEIRFETDVLQEILIGKLSNSQLLNEFEPTRLAAADIPKPIRGSTSQLKYQPLIEFRKTGQPDIVKLGSNVISYHVAGAEEYIGWTEFSGRLDSVLNLLFESIADIKVSRIGFRYINSLNRDKHHIDSLNDLRVQISVGGEELSDNLNLNFINSNDDSHETMVRIASPRFVQGNVSESAIGIIDIDVSTPLNFEETDLQQVKEWINDAHTYEKQAFFSLLPENTIELLREE